MQHGFPSPAYLNLAIPLQVAVHLVVPIEVVLSWPYSGLGIAPIVLGAALNVWAVGVLRARGTTLEFHETASTLVTDGPYRISRNPLYLGGILVSLGLAVLLGSLTPFAFPVALFGTLHGHYVPREERALLTRFGERYLDYTREVRRWL